jgi:hypothetical protein
MIVFGDGADKGEITTNLETNLESLHFLMSQTPVEISYALGPDSSDVRVAHGRLSSVTTPNVFSGRDYATVDYIFDIPDVFWRSADLLTSSTNMTISSSTSSYSPVSLSMLSGSTAPIDDMEIVVGGPFTRLDIVGNRLGSNGKPNWSNNNLVRITANITSSQAIYVDCANMQVSRQSKVNPTWNQVTSSGDLTGAVITAGLESSMSWLKLWPDASDGTFSNPDDRQMFISMTGLNTGSSNHFVAMRGRSCWL